MFDNGTYTNAISAFVAAGAKNDRCANAFAVPAFLGMIEGHFNCDGLLRDMINTAIADTANRPLSERYGKINKQNKPVLTSLPVSTIKAFNEVKAIWSAYGLKSATGDAMREALHGFLGYMTEEQNEIWLIEWQAYSHLKGYIEPGNNANVNILAEYERKRNSHRDGFLSKLYPDRPISFAALCKSKNKAQALGRVKAQPVPIEEQGDNSIAHLPVPEPISLSNKLAAILAALEAVSPQEAREHETALELIVDTCGNLLGIIDSEAMPLANAA